MLRSSRRPPNSDWQSVPSPVLLGRSLFCLKTCAGKGSGLIIPSLSLQAPPQRLHVAQLWCRCKKLEACSSTSLHLFSRLQVPPWNQAKDPAKLQTCHGNYYYLLFDLGYLFIPAYTHHAE